MGEEGAREALCRCLGAQHDSVGSVEGQPTHGLRYAAVLVPLVQRSAGLNVVLTRRADRLRSHAGQISFPGGRIEATDATAEAAAVRETREEIGIADSDVELLGSLPPQRTGTGFVVLPSVARLPPQVAFTPSSDEVAAVFEVPLDVILDPSNHQSHVISHVGERYRLGAIAYGEHFIWGATAGILLRLYAGLTGHAPIVDPHGEVVPGP